MSNQQESLIEVEEQAEAILDLAGVDAEPYDSDEVRRSKCSMTDPDWSDYVLSLFQPHEMDAEGNPKVGGLRRVARMLLGPIVASTVQVINAPFVRDGLMSVATVIHSLKILWCRREDLAEGQGAYTVEFSDVADVYPGNTDEEFAVHPSSTAATKAEARCLRKALQLQRVIAAEELSKPNEATPPVAEKPKEISEAQVRVMNMLCRRCNINLLKFINSGKSKFEDVMKISYTTAEKMVQLLSTYQSDNNKIPKEIVGYDADWRK